jgi:hypothetical protein
MTEVCQPRRPNRAQLEELEHAPDCALPSAINHADAIVVGLQDDWTRAGDAGDGEAQERLEDPLDYGEGVLRALQERLDRRIS